MRDKTPHCLLTVRYRKFCDVSAPFLKRLAFLLEVLSPIIGAGDASLVTALMIQDRFDNMWRGGAVLVEMCVHASADIVQNPCGDRLLSAVRPAFVDPGIERGLRAGPAHKAARTFAK